MEPNVFLSGITVEQLQDSLKQIVQNEVNKILENLPVQEKEPEYLTRTQVAQILGISLPTLNEWTKNGIILAKRIGTRVRYLRSDVYSSLKDIETLKYRRI
jgi:excisionase family DNA binding protein